jgi:hypothetical protein
MDLWQPSPWVLEHYPEAIRASSLIEAFLWFARETLGIALVTGGIVLVILAG